MGSIIYIIESPSAADYIEGRGEANTLPSLLKLAGIKAIPRTVLDEAMLKKTLEVIKTVVGKVPHDPILHFSAHGDERGIILTNGYSINWGTLRAHVAPLVKACRRKPLICFSTCEGLNAIKMAYNPKETVFEDLVGPKDEVTWPDSALAFGCFYNLFLQKGRTLADSVKRMNIAGGYDDSVFESVSGSRVRAQYVKAVAKRVVERLLS